MASWTDTQPLTFAPHIGVVDPELYGKVIAYKQQKYDQGLEQVQSALDKVGGLDIINPYAKEYYRQQFENVKNQLGNLSKADFSNNSIVSQATGMANSLLQDQRVQNAVISTQSIRALQKSQIEKKQKGEYAPQAAWYDNEQVDRYIKNNNLDDVYNGPTQALNYEDYNPELTKLLKDLSPGITYKINALGQFEYTQDKNSVISPAKIQQVVDGFFATNPKYQQSLQLDALYTYKDYNTIPQLKSKVIGFYDNVITQLSDKNKEYQKELAANPNDYSKQKQYEQFIADNNDLISQYAIKKEEKLKQFEDSNANLENLKLTLFNDQVRGNYIIRYQQDNHELEIKENTTSKNFFEAIKLGLDPETRMPMSPDSPWYATYLASKKGSKEDGKGTFSEDKTIIIGDPEQPENFTFKAANQQINDLESQVSVYKNRLRDAYFRDVPSATQQDFEIYFNEQNKRFLEEGDADENFKQYKKLAQSTEVQLNSLKELQNKVVKEASEKFPLNSIGDVNFRFGNVNLKFNPGQYPEFMKTFKDFYDLVNKKINDQISEYSGPESAGARTSLKSESNKKKVANEVLKSYVNDKNYNLLSQLVNTNLTEAYNSILKPYENLMTNRKNKEDELMNEYGKRYAYQMNIAEGKKEDLDGLAKMTAELISANNANKENISAEDIEVRGVYRNAKGEQKIVYWDKETKERKEVLYAGTNQIVPGYDPYDWLNKTIEVAGHTPYGENALSTDNGKLRYVISKNVWGNNYDITVLDGQKRIPLTNLKKVPSNPNSENIVFTHPSEILRFINEYSNQLNTFVNPPQPLTREELILSITNPTGFTSYMKQKYQSK